MLSDTLRYKQIQRFYTGQEYKYKICIIGQLKIWLLVIKADDSCHVTRDDLQK